MVINYDDFVASGALLECLVQCNAAVRIPTYSHFFTISHVDLVSVGDVDQQAEC